MTPTRALSARALSCAAALALSLGGAVGAFVLSAGPASADTITVTNTADDGNLDSLRGVLLDANDGDVIVLTAGATYQLTRCEENIKAIGLGQITIGGAVTIEGNGATIEQTCPTPCALHARRPHHEQRHHHRRRRRGSGWGSADGLQSADRAQRRDVHRQLGVEWRRRHRDLR